MKALKIIPVVLLIASASSCVREELAVEPYKNDDTTVVTQAVELGTSYTKQCYYSLKENRMVGSNARQDWSLAFDASPGGFYVYLNTGRNMFVYPTTKTDFASVKFSDRGTMLWDRAMGNVDSLAIGDWRTNGYVYIIDEGVDDQDVNQGWSKIQILSVDANKYTIRCSKINNSHDVVLDVPKNAAYNFSYVSIGNDPKVIPAIEPPKDSWDISFTRYSYTFTDPYTSYMVVGCLSNNYNTQVAEDSTSDFQTIDLAKAQSYTYSKEWDAIGYDWKAVGSTTGGGSDYKVNPKKIYIIKTSHDEYYKLRFIDFYNDKLEKGNPKWEYKQLL